MGGDGGTIPKRKDRVKTKKPQEPKFVYNCEGKRDPHERWKMCPISNCFIRKPVMAGQWGHVMSKEGLIEYLLKKRAGSRVASYIEEDSSPVCDPLHKMSDAIELKLKDNPALEDDSLPIEHKYNMGDFVCPITGLETNGKHKFVFSWQCGCVISERAFKECDKGPQMEVKKCLVCEKSYEPFDLIYINPSTRKEVEENQARFLARKMAPHIRAKKPGHQEDAAATGDLSSLSDMSLDDPKSSRSPSKRPSASVSNTPHEAGCSRPSTSSASGPRPSTSSSPRDSRSRPGTADSSSKRARSPTPANRPSTSSVAKKNK